MICLSAFTAWSQISVTGQVTDQEDGLPMPGATVRVKDGSGGQITNGDGKYTLNVAPDAVLIFSFVGYLTQEITVGNQTTINVALIPDVANLEEVVVIGYGTSTKKELTGSVDVVQAAQLEALNPTRLEQALQGQTSGVQITSNSGSPGGGFNIRIRGITTNGDNRPLIVIDGIIYENLDALNPNDVESINVLKDATAGIYGVNAANGVIIITTKSGGGESKPVITFDSYYGIQETARKIPVLNATEYAVLANEAFANGGQTPPFSNISALGEGTDWQDLVFDTAPIENYQFSVRGSGEKSNYAFSTGLFRQDGIVGSDKSTFERFTANFRNDQELAEGLTLITNANYSNVKRSRLLENALGSVLFNALNIAPTLSPRDEAGNFTLADGLGSEVINPLAQIANTFNETTVNRVFGKVGARYEIIPDLTFETSFNFDYSNVRFKAFSPIVNFGIGKVFNNVESSVTEGIQNFFSYNIDNVLSYKFNINGVHGFKVTAGSVIRQNRAESITATGFGIPNNSFEFADISAANDIRQNAAASFQGDARQLSYFARAEYNLSQKYFLSALYRRDGSTRFGPQNKFGSFYAVSGGWVVSDEEFLADSDLIDFLKFRASYGETGNDRIGDNRFVSLLTGEAEYIFNGNTLTSGTALGALSNPEIRWERNEQFNIGADFDLLDGLLSGGLDYYVKTTRDLLLVVPTSGLTGSSAPGGADPVANAGTIRNKGFEFNLNYTKEIFRDFDFSVGYNMTSLSNETIDLAGGDPIPGGGFGIGQLPPTLWQVGQSIGAYYGLKTDGVFQNQGEIDASAQNTTAVPGDLRYVDQNGDGVIDPNDRVFIGQAIPDLIIGFNISAKYKNFDFSAFAEGQFGADIVRNYERNLPLTNRTSFFLNRWTGEGSTNTDPRITTGANDNDLFSDFFVEDGSYVRIKNVQLGYTFPESVISKLSMTKLRLYFSVNNLFTFTDYRGYDPNISTGNPLASTIDNGFYPQARTYLVGLNVTF